MTKLVFVIGFLGSGKTTFIQQLLKQQTEVGLIINEFGKENIDRQLLNCKEIPIIEINSGSVFCDCKSQALIDGLKKLLKQDLDVIYVESTGLANPKSLTGILAILNKSSKHIIKHIGNIGIIDTSTVHKVISTHLVQNQIMMSNVILLNKIDLVSSDTLNHVKQMINTINPSPIQVETTYANWPINFDIFHYGQNIKNSLKSERPAVLTLDMSRYNIVQIEQFCIQVNQFAHRIKGYFTNDKTHYFEYTDDGFITRDFPLKKDSILTILSLDTPHMFKHVKEIHRNIFNDPPKVVTA